MDKKTKITEFNVKVDNSNTDALVVNAKNSKKFWKKHIQKVGSFMAGMIMPVVGILIAWGLFAAMFLGKYENNEWVKTGWIKFEPLGNLINPMMKYLIPVLIGYTAGTMIYKVRGGMIGAFLTFCAIVGNDFVYTNWISNWKMGTTTIAQVAAPNQIVGAMVIAPLFVYLAKVIESFYINRIKSGYEMLVRNFSQAFICMIFCLVVFFGWGYIMYGISFVMVSIIELFTKSPWLFPFMAIFTEPLRAVFLNNALNWGVMIPIGIQEVDQLQAQGLQGFSAFFMVGGNPGPGFGLLVAYIVWRKQQRGAASGSSIIQLIGGIHEVHYVYILTEPIMILATIGGAFTSLAIVKLFAGGAIAAISPGSMISVIAMSGSGLRIAVNLIALFAGAIVAFGIASFIMIFKKKKNITVASVSISDEGLEFNDQKASTTEAAPSQAFAWEQAKLLMVACDAGVGSSAMAAGIIKKWVKQNEVNITVSNCAVKDLDASVDIVVTMQNFVDFAHERAPKALIYRVKQFLDLNAFDELYKNLKLHLGKQEK